MAPASRAALRIAGASWSVRPGIIGATFTLTGIPASDNLRMAFKRACGGEVRGSITFRNFVSSVVTDRQTLAQLYLANSESTSISRVTRKFFVIMAMGLRN